MERSEFLDYFAGVFEHSGWIAEKAWDRLVEKNITGSFTMESLHLEMVEVMWQADRERQLALLNAHPQLAGKLAVRGELTADSTREQAGAKLNSLSEDEFQLITTYNQQYLDKFGFPFIIAVRYHDKDGIFEQFKSRLDNSEEVEFETALEQVGLIAKLRLVDIFEKL